jgi:hypothetical protein
MDNTLQLTGCTINPRECRCFEMLNKEELVELSGMSSETVIRALKKFQTDGIIRMNG